MNIRNLLTIAVFVMSLPWEIRAQELTDMSGKEVIHNQADSVGLKGVAVNMADSVYGDDALPAPVKRYAPWSYPMPDGFKFLPMATYNKENFLYTTRYPGVVTTWKGGALVGNIDTYSMFGRMGMESGGVSVIQNVGHFTFTAMAEGYKYGYFQGLSESWGIGGSMTYRASDRLAITLYGSYYTNPDLNQPGINALIPVTNFGGYVDWLFSEHWGVKAGAQAFHSTISNRWEVMPTVIPYYRFGNGQEIGIDVGSIVYEIVKSNIESVRGVKMNPTPEVPKIGPLPVGPALPPPVK